MLAAGSSSRLGRPKQMLEYNGVSFLQHHVMEALECQTHSIIVVLGAKADLMLQEIDGSKIEVVINRNWEKGLSTSLIAGLKRVSEKYPLTDGVIIMMCDQPYVTSSLLKQLILIHQATGKPIVSSNYGDTIGPPAFFHYSIFPELLQLQGDKGARRLIQLHSDKVATVSFPNGYIDIDTMEEYEVFTKNIVRNDD